MLVCRSGHRPAYEQGQDFRGCAYPNHDLWLPLESLNALHGNAHPLQESLSGSKHDRSKRLSAVIVLAFSPQTWSARRKTSTTHLTLNPARKAGAFV